MQPLALGPFVLRQPLAEGGMGRVFLAEHQRLGLPVAIKVLTARHARDERFRRIFRREIAGVARLDHPGAIGLLDAGVLPVDALGLEAGSPWLAMELAEGTLADGVQRSFAAIRGILLALLDVLAHAHAAGLVHCDLKPDNVLRVGAAWKLADFGLAHALDEGEDPGGGGTPAYMAPEQWRRAWRDQGPWTDLYALGGLAWELVTGAPPFGFRPIPELEHAHLFELPARLQPRIPVPRGLEGWLCTLLEKDPARRFRHAADATHALAALRGPLDVALGPRPEPRPGPGDTLVPVWSDLEPDGTVSVEPAPERPAPFERPPVPERWRRPSEPQRQALADAGLGLFGLRAPAFVDRERERDLLWAQLCEVIGGARARVVWISGPVGIGKSRLAGWLALRAAEVGAATVLRASHGAPAGPGDGLVAMLERWLRAGGLARPEVERRVRRVLPGIGELQAARVALLLRPDEAGEDERAVLGLATAPERLDALVELLAEIATRRPLLLWLDDLEWGPDSAALAEALAGRELPVLVVATLSAGSAPPERAEVVLGPLSPEDRSVLVRQVLRLSPEVGREVADRSAGVPLFAVQLVTEWVRSGALVPSPDGLCPATNEPLPLPDALHELWVARIDAVLGARPERDRLAVEAAAMLGRAIDPEEWRALCERVGAPLAPSLLDDLVDAGLVEWTDSGAAFVHGMLVESVRRLSDEGGWGPSLREAAMGLLRDRGLDRHSRGRPWAALRDLERARALSVGPSRAQLGLSLADCLRLTGRLDESLDVLRDVIDFATRTDRASLRARATGNLANTLLMLSRITEAAEHYEIAIRDLDALGETSLSARNLANLAVVRRIEGRFDEVAALLTEAGALYRSEGNARGAAHVLEVFAQLEFERARFVDGRLAATCRERIGEAVAAQSANDNVFAVASLLGLRGGLAVAEGRFDEGAADLTESLSRLEAVGALRLAEVHRMDLAQAICWGGSPERALPMAEEIVRVLSDGPRDWNFSYALAGAAELFELAEAPERALGFIERADAIVRPDFRLPHLLMLLALARLRASVGDGRGASEVLAQVTALPLPEDWPLVRAEIARARARVALAEGRPGEARVELAHAEAIVAEHHLLPGLTLVRGLALLRGALDRLG